MPRGRTARGALLLLWTAAAATEAPAPGLLRGSDGGETQVDANETVNSFWGISWGSCRTYGCSQPYQIGQLCGCGPGCVRLSICCSDYYQVCHHHPPAPAPPPPPPPGATCDAYGCREMYMPWHKCQCNRLCSRFGNCCPDYGSTCEGKPAPTPAPSPPAPAPSPVTPAPAPSGPSDAEVYTFYIYRAQGSSNYPPKNVNAANLAGAMWYLQHEVVITSPPKFGISRILRYKVQTKAPSRLLDAGMNFGVRYAYDSQKCTGPGDCDTMYKKYGFFVGCNNFASMYPYPNMETHYAGGVWYSFPGEGACEGEPTGASDCTYSYVSPPDEISLEELEGGDSTAFWAELEDEQANARKVQAAADLFKTKYGNSDDLPEPRCDFSFSNFWQ